MKLYDDFNLLVRIENQTSQLTFSSAGSTWGGFLSSDF
nr:MAG TPA: hypothetical protein [Caudoviricetes sp.]